MKLETPLELVLQQMTSINFSWEDIASPEATVCVIIMFLSGILCSAAGIGGGGIIVTVLMFFGRLSPYDAVPMSKAIVFLGAVSSGVLNYGKKFRNNDRSPEKPLIDWRIVKLTVPMALIGTLFGVLLNRETPGWQIVLVLTLILAFMTSMVVHKGLKQYYEEVWGLQQSQSGSVDDEETQGLLGNGNTQDGDDLLVLDVGSCEKHVGQNICSNTDVLMMGLLLSVIIFGGVLRDHAKSCRNEKVTGSQWGDHPACSHPVLTTVFGHRLEQWMEHERLATLVQGVMMIVPIWMCISIAMYYGYRVLQEEGWQLSHIMVYQSVALLTGLLAGLVGIGGGLILSPFFVIYGVEPSVAVATSSTCVVFTSSSTTFQYLLMDRIRITLAAFYGIANLFASLVGTSLVHHLQDTFASRKSYITFIVAVGVAASMVLSIIKLVEEFEPRQSPKATNEPIVLFGTDTFF